MKFQKHHLIKRLQSPRHHRRALKILPLNVRIESSYNKYFDYPLPELLADHSTDPMQNTARQYVRIHSPANERFANHEMIIRKNGESKTLRPQRDRALDNGFASVVRLSHAVPSYSSKPLPIDKRSSSIIKKLSVTKSKLKERTTTKQKRNHRHQSEMNVKEVLRNVRNESNCRHYRRRAPFQDLSSKYSNQHSNNKLIRELEDICFNRHSADKQHSIECSFDLPTVEDVDDRENSRRR